MINTYNIVTEIQRSEPETELRRQLKEGLAWSRLNSEFLEQGELLPLVTVNQPPFSPATLVPFPIATTRVEKEKGKLVPELLAQAKIVWCYRGQKRWGAAILKKVIKQMAYYSPQPIKKTSYCWFVLNTRVCPYMSALALIAPAIKSFTVTDAEFPAPPINGNGEAWRSAEPDAYGANLCFSAVAENDLIILTVALTWQQTIYLKGYRLTPERYVFFRQQLFFLLNTRLRPWYTATELTNPYKGTIYKKQ